MATIPGTDNPTIFWAKLGEGGGEYGYHPLICHLLDVAAVTEAMWDAALSAAARRGFAASLGFGDDLAAARTWVAFIAGLHDLGKCSPSFAFKPAAARLCTLAVAVQRVVPIVQPGSGRLKGKGG